MATGSIFAFTRTHCASHWLSCGQTRPHTEGNGLDSWIASTRRRQVAHQQVADEARDVDAHRAALDAGGLRALDAALGLAQRSLPAVAQVHLVEAHRARRSIALGHGHLVPLDCAYFL
jgi:hypothetical protein